MPANFNVTFSPNLLAIRSLIHGALFWMSRSSASVTLRNFSKLAVYWTEKNNFLLESYMSDTA